jgi:hypothetical protein
MKRSRCVVNVTRGIDRSLTLLSVLWRVAGGQWPVA